MPLKLTENIDIRKVMAIQYSLIEERQEF